MLWFLTLHILALLLWAASLLYLPLLLIAAARQPDSLPELPAGSDTLARFVFTRLATPAALLAIVSGTAVFLVAVILQFWMLFKLVLVVALVSCHALLGWLIVRAESALDTVTVRLAWLLLLVMAALMLAIVWLVLAKPEPEALLWPR